MQKNVLCDTHVHLCYHHNYENQIVYQVNLSIYF